jgi:hypothetical protein
MLPPPKGSVRRSGILGLDRLSISDEVSPLKYLETVHGEPAIDGDATLILL